MGPPQSHPMKLSFCTTCSNRLYQFEQTFEANLNIISQSLDTEWIIVNLGSKDALHTYMMDRLPALPNNIIYAYELESRPWHMSVAKNVAHRLGSGDILINLDCDNFIDNSLALLADPLSRGVQVVHLWSGVPGDGTSGRVAISRDIYYRFGGYDESFYPVGHEELDLLKRIRKSGIAVEHVKCAIGSAIPNSKEEGIKHCAVSDITWKECVRRNRLKSDENICAGRLYANRDKTWGKASLTLAKTTKSCLVKDQGFSQTQGAPSRGLRAGGGESNAV
jgi:hypothetical protein